MVVAAAFVVVSLVAGGCQPGPAAPDPQRAKVFAGLGAWWDVWDWSPTWVTSRNPSATPPLDLSHVDRLVEDGVQTLYIQPSTFRHPDVILDRRLLNRIIRKAHRNGIRVVGWYLPEFVDGQFDLERLVAMAKLAFDGIAFDIESTANPDVAQRTANLVAEVRFMRGLFPNLPIAAIPVTPIVWEVLNTSWWPNFPYVELSNYVDAWMPMAYWSYRTPESGWRDPYRYTAESVTRLRALTGRSNLAVHPIGGEAAGLTRADLVEMNRALVDTGAIGGSLYDDASTPAGLRDDLAMFRRDLVK